MKTVAATISPRGALAMTRALARRTTSQVNPSISATVIPMTCRAVDQTSGADAESRAADLEAFGFSLSSAGVFAGSGVPPAAHGLEVLAELGAAPPRGGSTPARAEDLASCDHVLCLTRDHRESLRLMLPPRTAANLELVDPNGHDIADPVGGSVDVYRACAQRIDECILARLATWA